jgi:hypothetical protein
VQVHRVVADRLHRPHTGRAIEDTDADVMSGRDPQNVQEVMGAGAGKLDVVSRVSRASIADFAGLEKNEIHDLVFIM